MTRGSGNPVNSKRDALAAGTRLRALAFGGLALLVAGCGVTYTSPRVETKDENVGVKVVELTLSSVAEANRSAYTPRSLPAVFFAAASGSASPRTAGAIPQSPFVPDEKAERAILRLPPAFEPGPYRVGVGDVLLLATRGSASTIEQLSGLLAAQNQRQGYTVRDDGAIAIPEVGTVPVAGMTLREIEDVLFQRLVEKQIDPTFSVEVADFNSQKVAVGGAVNRGGLLPITLNPLKLGEALAASGGLTVKDKQFGVIRIYRDGSLYQIPLTAYQSDPKLHDLYLKAGDAIYVDTTYDLDRAFEFFKTQLEVISLRGQARSSALAALSTEIQLQRAALQERRDTFLARERLGAVDRDHVYLTGEVNKQTRVPLPFEQQATLADVLYGEGGFDNTTGNPSEIYVLRAASDSEVTAYHVSFENAANIVVATRFQMRPNDVVFIEEQPITKWSRSLQQMFPTLLSAAGNSVGG